MAGGCRRLLPRSGGLVTLSSSCRSPGREAQPRALGRVTRRPDRRPSGGQLRSEERKAGESGARCPAPEPRALLLIKPLTP